MIKKADVILAVLLIAVGIIMSYVLSFGQSSGDTLSIRVDGKLFGTYSLLEDREIDIQRDAYINKVTIKNGTVSMNFSNCHGQDCVQQHAISRTGETIVCLPHKVFLEISGRTSEYDTISR